MAKTAYPMDVTEVVTTLADIFRHQQRTEIVEVLETAHAWFDNTDFDNWNGGTYTWVLRLEVPIPVFASIEPNLSNIEKAIGEKLAHFGRQYPNDHLTEATIAPITPGSPLLARRFAPSDLEVRRLWPENRFRLFVSHTSTHSEAVSKIKDELDFYGIFAFVAHEAIQPSLEWQREIELALRSMHALLALITPDFHASKWTDQEVGWAFGRGALVVPVRLGIDPYGFAGKVQGISGRLESPTSMARNIFETLLGNPQTHNEARRCLVTAFCHSKSFNQSIALRDYIPQISDFTDSEKDAMRTASEANYQLSNAYKVQETVYKAFGKPVTPPKSEDIPF